MTELFCTPYQGHKLSDLISDLSYKYGWVIYRPHSGWEDYPLPLNGLSSMYQNTIHAPALTLQELRDLAEDVPITRELRNELNNILWHFGAIELADWVIARLEEAK